MAKSWLELADMEQPRLWSISWKIARARWRKLAATVNRVDAGRNSAAVKLLPNRLGTIPY
jgi:hypothetical protein